MSTEMTKKRPHNFRRRMIEDLFSEESLGEELVKTNKGGLLSTLNKKQVDAIEVDLIDVITNAVDPHTKLLRDTRVDDRDIKEFPNYMEFITSKKGLGLTPYARQIIIPTFLLGEYCFHCTRRRSRRMDKPSVETWKDIHVKDTIDEVKERIQFLHYGECPKCGETKKSLLKQRLLNPYNELNLLAGQRMGKSLLFAIPLFLYTTHKVLKLPKPYQIYNLNPTPLVGTLVAQTFAAACDQLFSPLKAYVEESPWFNELHDLLRFEGNRQSQEFVTINQHSIFYKHKQLLVHPSGPNRKTLRGKTRFTGVIDELDFLTSDDGSDAVKMNAKEVHTSMGNSMANLQIGWKQRIREGYSNTPNAILICVSSPQDSKGFLTRRVKQQANSRDVFAVHSATWEVSPRLTRKRLDHYFVADEVNAMRDFGAIPPAVSNPFMVESQVEQMHARPLINRVTYKYEEKMARGNDGLLRRWAVIDKLHQPTTIHPSVMALDAGYSNNSLGLIIAHREDHLHGGSVNNTGRSRIIVDCVVEVMPVKGKIVLNYSLIYSQLIVPLIQGFNVRLLLADRWQSLKLLSDAEEQFKIVAATYSVKGHDFQTYRSWAESGYISVPPPNKSFKDLMDESNASDSDRKSLPYPQCFSMRPLDHYAFQHITVAESGNDVIKGAGLTDDLFRASVLASVGCLDEKFSKHLKGSMRSRVNRSIGAIGSGYNNPYGSSSGVGSLGSNAFVSNTNLPNKRIMGSIGR